MSEKEHFSIVMIKGYESINQSESIVMSYILYEDKTMEQAEDCLTCEDLRDVVQNCYQRTNKLFGAWRDNEVNWQRILLACNEIGSEFIKQTEHEVTYFAKVKKSSPYTDNPYDFGIVSNTTADVTIRTVPRAQYGVTMPVPMELSVSPNEIVQSEAREARLRLEQEYIARQSREEQRALERTRIGPVGSRSNPAVASPVPWPFPTDGGDDESHF